MASVRHQNFRLRGIPKGYSCRSDVRDLLQNLLSIGSSAELSVHSLAENPIESDSKVATLTFNSLPQLLQGVSPKNEWIFNLPSSNLSEEGDFDRRKPLVLDTHFSGFTPLQHTREEDCHVDVIAISGLGGHAFGSFKERNGSFMWLRDALPLDLNNARILIYGYDTRLIRSASFQSLTDLGRALHIDVKGIRQTNNCRPVVLIGHSLGGLVIKEAIVKMRETVEEDDKAMLDATLSFFFFGVPHEGMAIESLVPLVKDQPNRALLESLNKNSALLQRLERDFQNAFGGRSPRVVSFYETEKSPTAIERGNNKWEMAGTLEVLVDVSSATCGSKHQHPIGRNHSDMVKYNNQYDEFYVRVWIALRPLVSPVCGTRMLGKANEADTVQVLFSEAMTETLRSLSFLEQENRYNDIHSAEGTCNWIWDDPSYRSWTDSSLGFFWIKGNPGSGKSVLMKFAHNIMRYKKPGELIVSFFTHGRGQTLQKTPLGLFRALLSALLGSFPSYLTDLTSKFEDREKRYGSYRQSRWRWKEKELQEVLTSVLVNATDAVPVVLFIDALDEFGESCARSMLSYLKGVVNQAQQHGGRVKICVSSRHYPIIGLETVPTLYVNERNDGDIRHVIQGLLAEVQPNSFRRQLEKEITLKAQGGIQWAILVTERAIKEHTIGSRPELVYDQTRATPVELHELYMRILSEIPKPELHHTIKLFQWLLFSERPLSTQELRDALATDKNMDAKSVADLKNGENWVPSLQAFERRVRYLSRGLVEFRTRDIWEKYDLESEDSDREAQFIHQSVSDYLVTEISTYSPNADAGTSVVGTGHFELSRSCLRYMTLKEIREGSLDSRGKTSATFPLAPYVVQFLFSHIRKVESENIRQGDLLNIIQWDQQSELVQQISRLWKLMDPEYVHTPSGWPFLGASKLHVLIAFGLGGLLEEALQCKSIEVDCPDTDGNTPLMLAIREGHDAIAISLLNRSTCCWRQQKSPSKKGFRQDGEDSRKSFSIDVNAENEDGDTPMTLAFTAKAGHLMSELLDAGAYPKTYERAGELVFYAIQTRDMALLDKLISKGAKIKGSIFYAILDVSTREEEVWLDEVVRKLRNAGAGMERLYRSDYHYQSYDDDYFYEDDYDKTVFDEHSIHLASRRGSMAMVQLLLEWGADPDIQNRHGENALFLAVRYGNHEVAKLLLHSNPKAVCTKSWDENTAVDTALNLGAEELALHLILHGDFSDEESNRNTPMDWAFISHSLFIFQRIFEERSAFSNEMKWLQRAVEEDWEDAAVNMFTHGNASATRRDDRGRTPLMLSASAGFTLLARTLLSKDNSMIDATNNLGMSALTYALENKKQELSLLLLVKGCASNVGRDYKGRKPIAMAILNSYTDVCQALIRTDGSSIHSVDNDCVALLMHAVAAKKR